MWKIAFTSNDANFFAKMFTLKQLDHKNCIFWQNLVPGLIDYSLVFRLLAHLYSGPCSVTCYFPSALKTHTQQRGSIQSIKEKCMHVKSSSLSLQKKSLHGEAHGRLYKGHQGKLVLRIKIQKRRPWFAGSRQVHLEIWMGIVLVGASIFSKN